MTPSVLTYRVTLLEPVLVTALEGDPNSAVSFPYLPGSVLRGAAIAGYMRGKPGGRLDVTDPAVRRLFFDATTCYLNGYLVVDGQRTLPCPLSWQVKKGEAEPIYDFAVAEPPRGGGADAQWQPVSSGTRFCVVDAPRAAPGDEEAREEDADYERTPAAVCLARPLFSINVHTARDREYGRPREASGAVYRYQALAPGQTFAAAVVCDPRDAEFLQTLLSGTVQLGGSRSAGYGRAILSGVTLEKPGWREVGGQLPGEVCDPLMVTLLSPALLRDAAGGGQFVAEPEAVRAAIAARLETSALKLEKAFLRGQVTGGFNRAWGLPLPQALAVQPGSVFVFKAPGCDAQLLQDLEWLGIGERRAEGFGRVAVNWLAEERWSLRTRRPTTASGAAPVLSPGTESHALARRMGERLLRQALDARLAEQANQLGGCIKGPRNSQINRLRLLVQNVLQSEALQPGADLAPARKRLADYLEHLEERQATRKQFAHDRISDQSLMDWLRTHLGSDAEANDKTQILKVLGVRVLPAVGGVTAALGAGLAFEYHLRLVDAVLASAVKQRREGQQTEGAQHG